MPGARYQRPGLWRGVELRREIRRRFGITQEMVSDMKMTNWFNYMARVGIFPAGEVRVGVQQRWTDEQCEEIMANVPRCRPLENCGGQTE